MKNRILYGGVKGMCGPAELLSGYPLPLHFSKVLIIKALPMGVLRKVFIPDTLLAKS
jgi:hypothetical protein